MSTHVITANSLASEPILKRTKVQNMKSATDIYAEVLIAAAPAFANKNPNPQSALQLAHALAKDVVNDLRAMGIIDASDNVVTSTPAARNVAPPLAAGQFPTPAIAAPPPVAPPPGPSNAYPAATAQPQAHGVNGPQAPVAVGGGGAPAVALTQKVGGQTIVPAPGHNFTPPAQAGVMNVVQQTSTPQGHSALGTSGIISPVIQHPMGQEQIVAPAGEKVIVGVGGAHSTFIPEQIAR